MANLVGAVPCPLRKEWLSGTIQCPVARIGCAVNQLSVQVDAFKGGQTLGPPPAISQAVPATDTG